MRGIVGTFKVLVVTDVFDELWRPRIDDIICQENSALLQQTTFLRTEKDKNIESRLPRVGTLALLLLVGAS